MDGVASEYSGGRTADEIVAWVTRKSANPLVHLSTVEEADAFREGAGATGHVLLALLPAAPEGGGAAVAEALAAAARELEESFAVTHDAEIAKRLGVEAAPPAVALLKPYDEPLTLAGARPRIAR